jgi:hypothetical protein
MKIIRGNGYLVDSNSEERIADINYEINLIRPTKERFGEWSGNLSVISVQVDPLYLFNSFDSGMILHLEDGRSGKIFMRTPTQFRGTGPIE